MIAFYLAAGGFDAVGAFLFGAMASTVYGVAVCGVQAEHRAAPLDDFCDQGVLHVSSRGGSLR